MDLKRWTALCAGLALMAPPALAGITATRILEGLAGPTFATAAPGDPRLFVVERGGTVQIFDGTQLLAAPFLDLTGLIDSRGEGGLLSIAFPPGFSFAPGDKVYAYYTATAVEPNVLQVRISRFGLVAGSETTLADAATEEILFSVDKVPTNHNGGTIAFDGSWLYLGLGDGGGFGDPNDLAQDDTSVFGKLLRFDTSLAPPLVAQQWAKGLRNPFRFSFDRLTRDLYIADVGQSTSEEIHVQPASAVAGENFGWDVLEGTSCYDPDTPPEPACNDLSLSLPVYEYPHLAGGSCEQGFKGSVTGGYVYRGSLIPEIQGHYFFADFCTNRISSLVWDGAGGIVGNVVAREVELTPDQGSITLIVAFGEDDAGELYIVDIGGEVFKVPEPGSLPSGLAALLALAVLRRRRSTRSCPTRRREFPPIRERPSGGN